MRARFGSPWAACAVAAVMLAAAAPSQARFNPMSQMQAQAAPPGAAPPSRGTSVAGCCGLTLGWLRAPRLAAELSFDGTRAYAGFTGGRVDALTPGLPLRF